MPMPMHIAHATDEFNAFLDKAKEKLNLTTRNQVYTTVQSVLVVFRRRLTAEQILSFSQVLPSVLQSIFIEGWEASEQVSSFGCRSDWTLEIKGIRKHHNFSPNNAVAIVANCIRSSVDRARFDQVLQAIGPSAEAYWSLDSELNNSGKILRNGPELVKIQT